jgi:hypothetical protein
MALSNPTAGIVLAGAVFKTRERRAASLAGSIPVRLRHHHSPAIGRGGHRASNLKVKAEIADGRAFSTAPA